MKKNRTFKLPLSLTFVILLFFAFCLIVLANLDDFYQHPVTGNQAEKQITERQYEAAKKFVDAYDANYLEKNKIIYVDASVDAVLLKKLMAADTAHSIRENNFSFYVDSPQPASTDLFDGTPVTKKKVGIVGSIAQGKTHFVVMNISYDSDRLCMSCRSELVYYTFQLKNNEPTNIQGPLELQDNPDRTDGYGFNSVMLYERLEEIDLNKDDINEVVLHRVDPHEIGDSALNWAGDTLLKIEKDKLMVLVTLPIYENALSCGRCGDLNGKFYESSWEHLPENSAGFPDILLTRKLLFTYENGQLTQPLVEKIRFTYDSDKKIYLSK